MASTEALEPLLNNGDYADDLWAKYFAPTHPHDFGIYVGDKVIPVDFVEKRPFLLQNHGKEDCVVPLAVKAITPLLRPGGRGIVFWQLSVTEPEAKEFAAVIVASPAAPSYKAVLPMWYLTSNRTGKNAWTQPTESFEIRLTHLMHNLPGFPPEWTPFVLPDHLVGEALKSLRAYAVGNANSSVNPSNGVVFKGVPRLKAIASSCVDDEPTQSSQLVSRPSIFYFSNEAEPDLRLRMKGPDMSSTSGPINPPRKGFGASHPNFEGDMHGGYGLWEDKDRYDTDGELPHRAWEVESGIKIIPIHFVRLNWVHGFQPIAQYSIGQQKMIIDNRRSIVIGDAIPPARLRRSHGRFMIPSDKFPAPHLSNESKMVRLRDFHLVDEFIVDEDDLVSALTKLANATTMVETGSSRAPVKIGQCTASLREFFQKGADAVGRDGLAGTSGVSRLHHPIGAGFPVAELQ
ncbi:MAG: hypothetical protein Q9218_007457 [Villophora microphyllina]